MKSFKEVIAAAAQGTPVTVAVVAPYDQNTFSAVTLGVQKHIVRARLFGERTRIEAAMAECESNSADYEIVDSKTPVLSAIEAVRSGECDVIMKGTVSTPIIMSACLNKTTGLNLGRSLSGITVCEIPAYGKFLAVSDPALNILPTLDQKVDITRNMIVLMHAIGIEQPKIALLSTIEDVSLKIPSSMDAAIITQMNRRGQIKGAIVDGPLAFDNIVSAHAAERKGINSPVAGDADGIIVPNMECGNALVKSVYYFAGSCNAAVVVGAAAPIILPSRAISPEAKLAALALGALLAKRIKEEKQ
ncbi:MAG: bifunctional enoyl-CoA hydratase/phosphate acetyltransferase [Candidatus Scatomorpha sp.]|jgi:phosphate butyryltransferase